jgi:dipeptidyl aminopeptidase/acylaminoacyl peptidase
MNDTASPRPIQPDDLFALAFVQGGRLSPDGKQIVYAVNRTLQTDGEPREVGALWLTDSITGEHRPLTAGTHMDSAPAWSPDGTRIAFLSNRADKTPQLYVIAVDGGEARPLTAFKQGIGGGIAWSPDGRRIAFAAKPDVPPPADAPYRITRNVYRFNGMGDLDRAKLDLFIIPSDAPAPLTADAAIRVTDAASSAGTPRWSPDGTRLLYNAFMPPDAFSIFPRLCIVTLTPDARGDYPTRDLVGAWGECQGAAAWTADGARVAFLGSPAGSKIGSKFDLYVIDAAGGTPENRTAKLRLHPGNSLQSDYPAPALGLDGIYTTPDHDAYLHAQDGGMVHVYRVSLRGAESWIAVTSGERACLLQDVRAGTLLFAAADLLNPPDLYTISINGADERRITRLNAAFIAGIARPKIEHLLFRSKDGALVEGWLLHPPIGQAPYPTILYIHGGPHAGFGHTFSFDFQMLAGAGYAVLIVNQRGSTGYGDAFANAILGDWGNLDSADLMAGVDHVVAAGSADADRLGVCGLSGGGNLTCWIVGQTRRFKAAVPENPLTNWHSFYGVSDIGVWFARAELGGDPHTIPDVYARCSPITYAHTCTTPTLLVQCEHDWRCPPEQSEQFYTTLRANGCRAEMLRLPNEAHAGAINGRLTTRRAQNEALLAWMDCYVRGMMG